MPGYSINVASPAMLSVDQKWTNLMQKEYHTALQNGLASLWKSLHILVIAKDHINPDYVKVAGLGIVRKAGFDVEAEVCIFA